MKKLKNLFVIFISILFSCTMLFCETVFSKCPIIKSSDKDISAAVEDRYDMIPLAIRKKFEKAGWQIEITDIISVNTSAAATSKSIPIGSYVAGYCDTSIKKISLVDMRAQDAICHEMGHFVDWYILKNASSTKTFSKLFSKEAGKIDGGTNSYAQSDSEEYFAEAFSEYIICAGYLKRNAPKTFDYLNSKVGSTTTMDVIDKPDDNYDFVDEIPTDTLNAIAKKVKSGAIKYLPENISDALPDEIVSEDFAEKLKNDPEAAGEELGKKATEELNSIDWEEKNEEAKQKGKDLADKLNNLFSK